MKVVRYNESLAVLWNDFINNSNNGTFLFNRSFMEYHSDRFLDYSLVIYDKKDQIIAVLPASIEDKKIHSHQGLTYGGFIFRKDVKLTEVLEIFCSSIKFLYVNNITDFNYKLTPSFYSSTINQAELYAIFLLEALLVRRDTGFVVNDRENFKLQNRRKRQINKAKRNNITIKIDDDLELFWNDILIPNLKSKYNINPVHSLKEIKSLKEKFKSNIVLCSAYMNNEFVAGTLLFITKTTVHSQYIASIPKGRDSGALDYLFFDLLKNQYRDKKFFSFGISNENNGKFLNKGLAEWKEGFGSQIWTHDFYEIKNQNYKLLETFFND